MTSISVENLKREAAHRAAACVQDGLVVGLGSGSTARYATLRLAERLREGSLRGILGVATSRDTAALAEREGIPLTTLEEHPYIDITIDGADEVDAHLDVIKGLGGFLLREKIVAAATRLEIIVVDASKVVARLGTRGPLPVEVVRFGWRNTVSALQLTGADTRLRMAGDAPLLTDEGHYILDCTYAAGIADPARLHVTINGIPGVVDNGLFLGMVHRVIVAAPEGVRILERAL